MDTQDTKDIQTLRVDQIGELRIMDTQDTKDIQPLRVDQNGELRIMDTQDTKDIQPLRVDQNGELCKYSDREGDRLIKRQSNDCVIVLRRLMVNQEENHFRTAV